MLAVLDFFQTVMKRHYAMVDVRITEDRVTVHLIRAVAIPAEERLAQTDDGARLLEQVYDATFSACRPLLQARIEDAIGQPVAGLTSTMDPRNGTTSLRMQLLQRAVPDRPISVESR